LAAEPRAAQAAVPAEVDDRVLVCEDLHYSYLGRFPALDGVSLQVRRGESVALLGANGCGKSTLLKVLDGLIFPTSGTFSAFGQPVTEDTLEDEQMSMGFRSRVGFVFQNADAQVFSPSVREEVAFGPLQLGMHRDEAAERTDDVLRMLGIDDLVDRAPFQLSGGQKKKVAIATVLVMNPDVLLFDEPTAALDPRTQQWLIEVMEELGRGGKTIVHATHDLGALDRIADRCIVFNEAHRIVAEGAPGALMEQRDLLTSVNLIAEHSVLPRPRAAPAERGDTGATTVRWNVPGVTCEACERKIVNATSRLPGVRAVAVDLTDRTVSLRLSAGTADPAAIRDALAGAGYPVRG
jgi:cobalt/nickel transport system ATP-binding protein